MTTDDLDLPLRRAAQMDAGLAAGLTLEQLDVLTEARRQWQAGDQVWVGVDTGTGDLEQDAAAGHKLLLEALANPAATEWDAVTVSALRRQIRGRS